VKAAERRARLNPDVALLAATAAHARGLLRDDVGELTSAVELLQGGPRPLVLASVLEDLGRGLVDFKRRDHAVSTLGEALEHYAAAGASWDESRVRSRLRKLGVRRRLVPAQRPERGWEALTDSELRAGRALRLRSSRQRAPRKATSMSRATPLDPGRAQRALGVS
jgi:hypothetical protein